MSSGPSHYDGNIKYFLDIKKLLTLYEVLYGSTRYLVQSGRNICYYIKSRFNKLGIPPPDLDPVLLSASKKEPCRDIPHTATARTRPALNPDFGKASKSDKMLKFREFIGFTKLTVGRWWGLWRCWRWSDYVWGGGERREERRVFVWMIGHRTPAGPPRSRPPAKTSLV